MPRLIGLTGGIATGKSTVSRYLQEHYQLPILDADIYAREAVKPDSPILKAIYRRFGKSLQLPDGSLNRRALGEIIFVSETEKAWLEAQIHPYVRQKFSTNIAQTKASVLVLVIPLLWEAKMSDLVTEIWVVACSQAEQISRLQQRDGLNRQQAIARLQSQLPLVSKIAQADQVLYNNSSIAALYAQVDLIMSPSPSARIVSLLPSATEIVTALGLSDVLVGRSHECDYPVRVKELPPCTKARLNSHQSSLDIDRDVQSLCEQALSIYELELETLQRLQPTHIVTQDQCDVCAVSFSQVTEAVEKLFPTPPEIISLQPNSLAEVWQDIARVAKTLQINAQPLLDALSARVSTIQTYTENLNPAQIPTVVTLEWIEPLMVGGNWIHELVTLAGGKPLLSHQGQPSSYISWEELIAAQPDVIVIMPCGFDLERNRIEAQTLCKSPLWQNLPAVQNQNVFLTDGNAYFNRPGPRLVDSLEILAEILHPEQFSYGYQSHAWQKFLTR